MSNDPLFYVVVASVLAVAGILLVGIGGFGRGGEFNKKHGNRMMRWRIAAQFFAVLMILGYVALRGGN